MNEPAMIGPYTRPLGRDPAAWFTLALVVAATIVNALRAWSESSSVANALIIGGATFVLSAIATMFLVALLVGIPRGWRLGRSQRPPPH